MNINYFVTVKAIYLKDSCVEQIMTYALNDHLGLKHMLLLFIHHSFITFLFEMAFRVLIVCSGSWHIFPKLRSDTLLNPSRNSSLFQAGDSVMPAAHLSGYVSSSSHSNRSWCHLHLVFIK